MPDIVSNTPGSQRVSTYCAGVLPDLARPRHDVCISARFTHTRSHNPDQ